MLVQPVILAGGSGSRLWPVSRQAYPKQLLPLVSSQTLLQETVLRTRMIKNILSPLVICNQEHRFLVAEQLKDIDVKNPTIMLEPVGKNTAPAVAMAALYYQKENPLLLVLPADHLVRDVEHFTEAVNQALMYAQAGKLITFGIVPTHPETGYGYIKVAEPIKNGYRVQQFVEKPKLEIAKSYVDSGEFYWNSGMFLFSASAYLHELQQHAPDILQTCKENFTHLSKDLDFVRLEKSTFDLCPSNSIDYAIMEKAENAVLIPLKTDWNDIGSWDALCNAHKPNQEGNVLLGDVITEGVKNSYLRAESRMLAAVGVSDHIIVETLDAVLVAHKDHCQDIKKVVAKLKQNQRSEADLHRKAYRPWGYYELLYEGNCFQVKHINIKPGARLSLQMHFHRSEHWVIVEGKAEITCGDKVFELSKNESTYIPKGIKHRLVNNTSETLDIIEIQLGDYLGEDDIVRFEDSYGRIEA